MKWLILRLMLAIFVVLAMTAGSVQANTVTLNFDNITGNSAVNAAIGENQFSADITEVGTNQVLFTFRNTGTQASSISQIYFDDGNGTLLESAQINNSSPGVDFIQPSTGQNNLPGGNNLNPPFESTKDFRVFSNPPANGVNPGEALEILFNLQNGSAFGDVLAALALTSANPDDWLRIGIHAQAFRGKREFCEQSGPRTRYHHWAEHVCRGRRPVRLVPPEARGVSRPKRATNPLRPPL
jgi:hypothetical protein